MSIVPDPNQEDDEVDDNFGRRKGKQGRERADTTPTWGSNKSTPRGEEDTPEGFKRLTRGRSVDSLNSKSDGKTDIFSTLILVIRF